ncbi:single-stranded DNA-binding protein [Patescibacteria group bacterium]|nr:single-stranded DNA-binding protein [Patescibacteria group bacterium]
MATRSLNKAQLIGNLTRDPELRYTPQGTAVCTFGLATNRTWVTEAGDQREDTQFHRIVAWNKLAEICSQLLFKGRRVYVEGRLKTRQWTAQDGSPRQTTEIVIDEMLILDSKRAPGERIEEEVSPEEPVEMKEELPAGEEEAEVAAPKKKKGKEPTSTPASAAAKPAKKADDQKEAKKADEEEEKEEVKAEDIPF